MSNPQVQPPHKDTGQAAFEAAKQRQLAALQNKIAALEQQIVDQLPHIGQLALRLHQSGHNLPPELQSLCAQVAQAQQQISAAQQETLQVQQRQYQPPPPPPPPTGNLVCPRGHGILATGNQFCTICGSRGVGTPAGAACRRCGNPLESGVRFCTECGLPVSGPLQLPAPSRCFKCGEALLQPDQKFCVNCGQLLTGRPPAGGLSSNAPTIIEPTSSPGTISDSKGPVKTLLIRPTAEDAWSAAIPGHPPAPSNTNETPPQPPTTTQTNADHPASDTLTGEDLTTSAPPPATRPTDKSSGSYAKQMGSSVQDNDLPSAANPAGAKQPPRSCPSCGTLLAASATACPTCGYKSSPPKNAAATPPTHCPRCQEPLMAEAAFCIICGCQITSP